MKQVLAFLVLVSLYVSSPALGLQVVSKIQYDQRKEYLDIIPANSIRGETVRSILSRCGRSRGINGSFFAEKRLKTGIVGRYAIGTTYSGGNDISVCPAPEGRCHLYQTDKTHIGFQIPPNPLSAAGGFAGLLCGGKYVRSYQGFPKAFWNRRCLRSIVALKGNEGCLMTIHGSLWEIMHYLRAYGFTETVSLDGGSSSGSCAHVANALVVFPKTWHVYSKYYENLIAPGP